MDDLAKHFSSPNLSHLRIQVSWDKSYLTPAPNAKCLWGRDVLGEVVSMWLLQNASSTVTAKGTLISQDTEPEFHFPAKSERRQI